MKSDKFLHVLVDCTHCSDLEKGVFLFRGYISIFASTDGTSLTKCATIMCRKFLLTKPMHMGAEDTGVCQLHAIGEDPVNTGFGTSSGEQLLSLIGQSNQSEMTLQCCRPTGATESPSHLSVTICLALANVSVSHLL